jgi:hypothetical protein
MAFCFPAMHMDVSFIHIELINKLTFLPPVLFFLNYPGMIFVLLTRPRTENQVPKINYPHMSKTLCYLGTWLCVATLAISCHKDNDDEPPQPDVIETQPATLTPITQTIGNNVGGYYEALPALYTQTKKKYPLLIFLHGAGQFGSGSTTDLDKVLTEGTPKLLKEQKFPPNFVLNGKIFPSLY